MTQKHLIVVLVSAVPVISHFSQSDTELSNQADIAGAEYFSTLTVMQKKYLILTIENTNFLIFCLRMYRITEEFVLCP